MVTPVLAEAREHLEQPDHQVVKVRPDQVEVLDLQEWQVPADCREEVAVKAHPELAATRDHQVSQVLRELPVHQVTKVCRE